MPIISSFYGITIKMYFQQADHNPPHIHAIYGEYVGVINIQTGLLLEGDLPLKSQKLIKDWLNLNRDTLLEMWNSQTFQKIPPL